MTAETVPPLVKAATTPNGDRVDTGHGTHLYVPAGVMPPGPGRIFLVLFVALVFLAGVYAPRIFDYLADLYAGTPR